MVLVQHLNMKLKTIYILGKSNMKKIKTMKSLVKYLIENNKKISAMESCTGGEIASTITNIEGASNVFEFSAVTYSNEYKIKMGVNKEVINKYSVYSIETANEMSKTISKYTNTNYSIGVTGQLKRKDPNNKTNEDNKIYISIYNKDNDTYHNKIIIHYTR